MSLDLDKSTWKSVAFGDVVKNVNTSVKDPAEAGIDRVIAMEHLDRGELKISRWGSIEDGTTFTRRVLPGQTLFGKRRAYQRKAAYADFDAICSGDILVFQADPEQLLPEFLPFLVQSERFYDHALGTSAGSLSPRTNWGDLSTFEFDLPPVDEQQRIADLLWSIEQHRLGLAQREMATGAAFETLLRDRFASAEGASIPIADLCSDVIGGIWGSPEGDDELDVLALGPRVYSTGSADVVTDGSPVRSITTRQAQSRLLQEGDVILERSGGSPTQAVGRVVIAGHGLPPCIPTDFQRLLRPNRDLVEPRYLFWRLHHDWASGVTRDYSKKTTNITNLTVPSYLAREIVVPPRDVQADALRQIERVRIAQLSLRMEVAELSGARSTLSVSIFGGVA